MNERTDRRFLTEVAYVDDGGLTDRVALYDCQQPRIDLVGEAMSILGGLQGQRVVDVGCGNGRYAPALVAAGAEVIALDLSSGMLTSVPASRPLRVVGDAQRLPLPDSSVDVALLMHMLYHVPDPDRAVGEARRVLRPGGRALVATAGDRHLEEMNAVWLGVLEELDVRSDLDDLSLVNRMFPPRDASVVLGAHFSDVVERTLRASVVVSDPGPVIRHAASTAAAYVSTQDHPEVIGRLRERIAAVIARDGEFRTTTETVLLLAR